MSGSTTKAPTSTKPTKQASKPVKTVDQAVPAPPEPAPAAAEKPKKGKKPETTVSTTPAPVTETSSSPAPQSENEVVSTPATDGETSLTDLFAKYNKSLQDLTSQLATLKSEFRAIEKSVSHKMRAYDKINARKNKNRGNRAPSGFVKPTKISNELADFLKVSHGTLMARTDVTRKINEYIRENNLRDADNGRIIKPDTSLSQLLNYDEKTAKSQGLQQLSYFNLQKYLAKHFIKEQK
jgi:chromatin remodeling complex protein RSC6